METQTEDVIKTKENEMPEIETQESRPGFENSLYEGYRAKIANIELKYVQNCFPDGVTYNPNSIEKKWVLRISTEPLKVLEQSENGEIVRSADDVEFRDSETGEVRKMIIYTDLNMQNKFDYDKNDVVKSMHTFPDGKSEVLPVPVISKAPKANLWKFLGKMKCQDDYRKLKGMAVTLTLNPSKSDPEKSYINIVTK